MIYEKEKKIRFLLVLISFIVLSANVSFARHFSVNLQSVNGNFVTAENGGGRIINANRPRAAEWETFILLDLNEGELANGDPVAIKTINGNFFSAIGGGGDNLFADKTALVTWETFIIERKNVRNGDNLIKNGDKVTFKSWNKNYISAMNGGGREVNCKPSVVSNSEIFTVRITGTPAMSKLSGLFTAPQMIIPFPVGVDENNPASSDVYKCNNSYLGRDFPNCYREHEGTDFGLAGGFIAMNLGSIDIYTVAGGKVVAIADGNPDRCYFKFPPPPPNSSAADFVFCPNDPNDAKQANFVAVLQDDGVIAYYYHMKRETVAVNVGARVDCGQFIGKVGSSGVSSAPHLHLTLQTIPLTIDFPSTADKFDSIAGSRSAASMINPYSPMLWTNLIGRIPKKTCAVSSLNPNPTQNLDPPGSRGLGEAANNPFACQPGLVLKDGVCKRVGVPPRGKCSDNELCGPGLGCDQGKCVLRRP